MGRRSRRRPHTAKPYAARRASALTALFVRTAAFVEAGKSAGELKAAVLVRKRRAVQKRSPPEGACQPLRGFLAPSSAGAAAFSIPVFPETSAETPRLSHSCKSAVCKAAHLAVLTSTYAARRPAPKRAGRHGAAAKPPPAAYGEAVCGAPRYFPSMLRKSSSGVLVGVI